MKRHILAGCLVMTVSLLLADTVKTYTDPRSAIAAARNEGKLIVFLLADGNDAKHKAIETKVSEELNILSSEFVLVKLAASQKPNRDLISGRFGKDLSSMPVAVVTDSSGAEITSCQGQELLDYRKMVITARVEGGIVKDPLQLANLRESLKTVGQGGGIFGAMVEDLGSKKVAITPMRDWSRKDGTTFKALLLEALGDTGVFVDEGGKSHRIKFGDLSKESIEYLQTVLTVQ